MVTLTHSYPINITTPNIDTKVDIARDPCSSDPKGTQIPGQSPSQELGDGLCLRAEWQTQNNFCGYIQEPG